MGNQKQKWTADEEVALQAGVAKHGPGKWKNILKDPEFAPFLTTRSNIDLKDKWRNLSVSNSAQGSKERSRNPKPKTTQPSHVSNVQNPASAPALALALTPSPAPAPSLHQTVASDAITNDPSNKPEGKEPPGSYAIFDALSTIKDSNGSDVNSIYKFIEQKYDVSHNFRKQLATKLRRLVAAGKLEKIQNNYKLKNETTLGTNLSTSKPKHVRPRQIQVPATMTSTETVKTASDIAARLVSEAEQKSTAAALAVNTYETLSKLAEEIDLVLQLVKDINEQCTVDKWLHYLNVQYMMKYHRR